MSIKKDILKPVKEQDNTKEKTRLSKPKTKRRTKPKTKRRTKPKATSTTKTKTIRATKPKATKPKATRTPTTKVTKPKKKISPEELHKIRSQAAKKGWETRRKNIEQSKPSRTDIERENLYGIIQEISQYADGAKGKTDFLINIIKDLPKEQLKGVTERVENDRYFNIHLRAFLYNDDGTESSYLQMLLSTIKGTPLSLVDVENYDTGVEHLLIDTETGEIIT